MLSEKSIITKADQCVLCGLCLTHCPTYMVSQHEGESPRGRISLVKALAQGELQPSPATQSHLQSCTACMNCEKICPANVSYSEIIDAGRALYRPWLDIKTRCVQFLSTVFLTTTWGRRCIPFLINCARLISNLRPFRHLELIKLARILTSQKKISATTSSEDGNPAVTIFPGCTGQVFDSETLNSSIRLVSVLGYNARVPQSQLCCSALAQHSGQLRRAKQQQDAVQTFLHAQGAESIISIASGCGQQLDRISNLSAGVHLDIHNWLITTEQLHKLKIRPLTKKVLMHVPCSMQTNSVNPAAMKEILLAIPGLTLLEFNDNVICCGAGGMQLLTPEKSNRALLQSKLDAIHELKPDVIVSPNIGCALQFRKGIRQTGSDIEVIHPITLLIRQIEHL